MPYKADYLCIQYNSSYGSKKMSNKKRQTKIVQPN